MNYHKLYAQIIYDPRNYFHKGYVEKHHILPISLGGGDEKENIVQLTARQHFVVHWLLTKMYIGGNRKKMIYALHRMSFSNRDGKRYKLTSFEYESIRKLNAELTTERNKLPTNPFRGGEIQRRMHSTGNHPFSGEKGSRSSRERILRRIENGTFHLAKGKNKSAQKAIANGNFNFQSGKPQRIRWNSYRESCGCDNVHTVKLTLKVQLEIEHWKTKQVLYPRTILDKKFIEVCNQYMIDFDWAPRLHNEYISALIKSGNQKDKFVLLVKNKSTINRGNKLKLLVTNLELWSINDVNKLRPEADLVSSKMIQSGTVDR